MVRIRLGRRLSGYGSAVQVLEMIHSGAFFEHHTVLFSRMAPESSPVGKG